MKIYIAAPFSQRERAADARRALEALGFTSTARWIDSHFTTDLAEQANLAEECLHDLADIDDAEAMVLLNGADYRKESSGGMNVELGYALANGKRVFLIGGRSNVFHFHPNVTAIDSLMEVK